MNRIKGVSSLKRAKSIGKMRIAVSRSGKHVYAQLVDDRKAITVVGLSTNSKAVGKLGNVEGAKVLGEKFAKLCIDSKITSEVYMDRCGRKYAGVLASFADSARANGLKF